MHKYLCKDYMSVEFQVLFLAPCRHKSLPKKKKSDIYFQYNESFLFNNCYYFYQQLKHSRAIFIVAF